MSLPVPLTVRVSTSHTDTDITRELRTLSFVEVADGGYASIRLAVDRPLHIDPDDLQQYARVYVYDSRSGVVASEGRLNEPGRGVGRDGQVWELTARGPMAHMWDRTVPMVYVDRDLSAWTRTNAAAAPGASVQVGDDPGTAGAQAIVLQFPAGTPVAATSLIAVRYRRALLSGQKLARIFADWKAGQTNSLYQTELYVGVTTPGGTAVYSVNLATGGGQIAKVAGDANWAAGANVADLIHDCDTAGTPGTDDHWISLRNVAVRALLRDAAGIEITTGYTSNTVLASQVFADLVGRLVPQYDGANATIQATTHPIDHLVHPDGITPGKLVEDDLLPLETGHRWGAYESNTTGLHRVEFVTWPTDVRYEADPGDGFSSPEPTVDIFNQVTVRYRDAGGDLQTLTRTQTVEVLDDAGITRTAPIDLGDEIGSQANAERAGDQFLAAHQYAPNAGRLTVARPILDRIEGRMVWPWEVKAGELLRVQGVRPRIDALNATDRDGATVFRIWAKEWSDGAATLDLDSYARSAARSVGRAARATSQRRRR